MPGLRMRNVTKRFGTFVAVDDVSLDVAAGEVLCLLGPSGCGKTTTLRMIAGLETVSAGAISFNDRDVTRHKARDRNVAMAFQFYALYPNLTVGDNLIYPLHAEGLSAEAIMERQRDVAEILKLAPILGRYPHQLSEGEKQRVAVGRCVIRDPEAFLFDEPLSRLDVKLREEMRGDIRQILSRLQKPTVIVTHDQLEAMTMGDKIAVMRDGRIEQVANQQDIFDRPVNTFVAGFLGTPQMNLIDGVVTASGTDSFTFAVDGHNLELPQRSWQTPPLVDSRYTIGVRPRAMDIASSNMLIDEATVEMLEPMSAETLVHLRWGGALLRMIVGHLDAPKLDKIVGLSFSSSALHLFDHNGIRVKLRDERGATS